MTTPSGNSDLDRLRARYSSPALPTPAPAAPPVEPEVDETVVRVEPTVPAQWADTPKTRRPLALDEPTFSDDFDDTQSSRSRQRLAYDDDEDDFRTGSDDFSVNTKRDRPQQGVRKFLSNTLHLPVGKSQKEQDYDALIARIGRSMLSPKIIGVYGGKGGIGKTSITQVLGSTLAQYQSKSVVAITLDYNSTLSLRTKSVSPPARGDVSIIDMATDNTIRVKNDITACMRVNKHLLNVLGTGLNPLHHEILTPEQYFAAIGKLKECYEYIIVDFGNTPNTASFWTALKSLDALVLVTSTENDSMRGTKVVEAMVKEAGLHELLEERTIVLVNHRSSADPKVDLDTFVGRMHAVKRREVLDIPWDDHLSESGPVDLDLLSKPTRYQFIRAAALIVSCLPA